MASPQDKTLRFEFECPVIHDKVFPEFKPAPMVCEGSPIFELEKFGLAWVRHSLWVN